MLSYWMIQDTKGLASKSYERNMIIMNCMAIHQGLEYDNVFINHHHVMNLTYFMARSTCVAYAFEWGKLLSFEGKRNLQEIGKWTEY